MSYSADLRNRVVSYVKAGGSKIEAARRFDISRRTVYNWLASVNLPPKPRAPHARKFDLGALRRHVQEYPDAILSERAQQFGVSISTIWYHLNQMNLCRRNHQHINKRITATETSLAVNTVTD